ncbi:restriction endonuclease [Nocardiopsis sp. EMB25]|uniref:restriction endonuclease n=1 Tax=Nocardiopsis sp. EMB25 TaxID=2835867 RepID=UPI002284B7F9|nr:restriction endonuclease [Nocardiopsis sp. EMB25]MCY9783140.1 restriction endonuclease [Nocardiopsis sp. EMB25]
MRAWIVRAGSKGEWEPWALENGCAAVGFTGVPDLSPSGSREDVFELLSRAFPTDGENRLRTLAAQLWAFRSRIQLGDLIVLPLKTRSAIAVGRVTGEYEYRSANEPGCRHVRRVEWLRDDVPRSAVRQDLLYSLGAFLTVCQVRRNDGAWRIDQVARRGSDPGARTGKGIVPGAEPNGDADEGETSDVTAVAFDIEQQATDRLRSHLIETFAGHRMQELVAAVLAAEGFHCTTPPMGPDGGIDVLAGTGPLGLGSPRIVVQVKSEAKPVGAPVVQQLLGAVGQHNADHGLLVAWGGVTREVDRMLMGHQYFTLRIWQDKDLMDAIFRTYDRLPEEIVKDLPLKRVWTLVEESG